MNESKYGIHSFVKDVFSYLYDMNDVNWVNKK